MAVIILVKDLVFRSKVKEATAAIDVNISYVRNGEALLTALRTEAFELVVLDLNLLDADIGPVIKAVKEVSPQSKVIGFGSHVNKEYLDAAREAGADTVLPRSKFFGNLTEWLKG